MTIYISHSRAIDYKKLVYAPIRNSSLAKEHIVILPHEESGESYDTKALFAVKKCDLVIAEVSLPATGQGIELGWADALGIPIICLYKEGAHISQSLNLVSKSIISYKDTQDMLEEIGKILSSRSHI